MSSNPINFRLPLNIAGKVDPDVAEAVQYHDDAINDLQQAIPVLTSKINALKPGTPATGTTAATTPAASETVIIPSQPSTIGMVNNQAGNTSYSTQQSDYGAFILFGDASVVAVTLAQGTAITVPWFAFIVNQGAGLVTLTPATGTISYPGNLSVASMPVPQYFGAAVVYDGTNFDAILFPVPPQNTPAVAHEWLNAYSATTGAFTQTQPAFSDISGQIASSQLPSGGLSVTITTAKLTTGGANGSMTFTNGQLTAQTAAT